MNYSELKIKFTEELDINDQIGIKLNQILNGTLNSSIEPELICVSLRDAGSEFTKAPLSTPIISEQTAINFLEAFKIDYAYVGTITTHSQSFIYRRLGNQVFIRIYHSPTWSFEFVENSGFASHSSVEQTFYNNIELVEEDFPGVIRNPNLTISKANSLRFAKRVDLNTILPNDENTLSCEAFAKDEKVRYMEYQLFETGDIIPMQYSTNILSTTVKLIYDNQIVNITPVKKSNNFNNVEKLDGKLYSDNNGKTYVYFTTGKTYDVDGNEIGSHDYNGFLPRFAVKGNYISIHGKWYFITDVVFVESLNADAIVINENISSTSSVIITSVYNLLNYEVFEFNIDTTTLEGKNCRVEIDGYETYLSEYFNVEEKQENTVEVIYWNESNTDVNYSYGIRHLLRLPVFRIDGINEQDFETTKSDTNIGLLSSVVYEGDEFTFEPNTKEIMRKIVLALSSEKVFINRVGYVKNTSIEVEGAIDDTNLYQIKPKMLKSGEVYSDYVEQTNKSIIIGDVLKISQDEIRQTFEVDFSINFSATNLIPTGSVNGQLVNYDNITTLSSPMTIYVDLGVNDFYIKITDFDFDANEIISNSYHFVIEENQSPYAEISWDNVNTNNLEGTSTSILIKIDGIFDPEELTPLTAIWQRKLDSGSWVDDVGSDATGNEETFSLSNGINQFRLKATDSENNIGYSNVLQYTKTEFVSSIINDVSNEDVLCYETWEIEISETDVDVLVNLYLDTTNNGVYYLYTSSFGTTITSDTTGITKNAGDVLQLSFGIDASTSGTINESTSITVEVYDESDNLLESKTYTRAHSNLNC